VTPPLGFSLSTDLTAASLTGALSSRCWPYPSASPPASSIRLTPRSRGLQVLVHRQGVARRFVVAEVAGNAAEQSAVGNLTPLFPCGSFTMFFAQYWCWLLASVSSQYNCDTLGAALFSRHQRGRHRCALLNSLKLRNSTTSSGQRNELMLLCGLFVFSHSFSSCVVFHWPSLKVPPHPPSIPLHYTSFDIVLFPHF
jgi:hypothetical protein